MRKRSQKFQAPAERNGARKPTPAGAKWVLSALAVGLGLAAVVTVVTIAKPRSTLAEGSESSDSESTPTGADAKALTPVAIQPPLGAVARVGKVLPITFNVKQGGQVSLAVYDGKGTMLRTLLTGENLDAGRHTVYWDGLDRFGRPAQPGNYQWRMLRTPGFKAEYLLSVGNNRPGGDNWNEWIGNHGPLHSIVCDGTWVYAGGMGENVPGSGRFKLDSSETGWLQGNRMAWGTTTGIAVANLGTRRIVLRLISNADTSRVDAAHLDGKDFGRPINVLDDDDRKKRWIGKSYGFAANDKGFVIASPSQKTLHWYSHRQFSRKHKAPAPPQRELKVPAAGPLAMKPDGTLFMLANGAISIVGDKGKLTELIPATELDGPRALAYQPETGDLLVAVHGDSRQVLRFDAATGRRKAAYGRRGGRLWGPYQPKDFRDIKAVCGDGRGGFLVIEGGNSVRRIAHFARGGTFIREWPTGQQFFNFASFDPADPTVVIYRGAPRIKCFAKCDYKNGTWKVTHEFRHDYFGTQIMPMPAHYSVTWHPIRRNGELYLWAENGQRTAILHVDFKQNRLVPLVAAGSAHRINDQKGGPFVEARKKAGGEGNSFIWSDTNGNGEIDAEEIEVGNSLMTWGGASAFIDADFNLYGSAGSKVRVLRNQTPNDPRPTWSAKGIEMIATADHPEVATTGIGHGSTTGLHVKPDRTVYRVFAANGYGRDRPAHGWPTLITGTTRFLKHRTDGTIEWVVGRHASRAPNNLANPSDPGQFHDDVGIVGTVHNTIVLGDRSVTPAAAWTEDGLYAGAFYDRRADDGLPGHVYHWWRDPLTKADGPVPYDMKTNGSVLETREGALWAPMGEQNSPIYRVTGWDGWQRETGTVECKEVLPHADFNGTGLTAEYFPNATLTGKPAATRTEKQLWQAWPERGRKHGDWHKSIPGGIDRTKPFSVRWSGTLTPHLTEAFIFAATNREIPSPTKSEHWNDTLGGFRLRLGGRLILDNWSGADTRHRPQSKPIPLRAGRPYQLEVDYVFHGKERPQFSLVWESVTQERQRIPAGLLQPARPQNLPLLRIESQGSLDETSDASATFTVVADKPVATELKVLLEPAGTAQSEDVSVVPAAAVIPAGKTRSAPITMQARDDKLIDGPETFGFALRIDPAYVGDGSRTAAVVPIADDEAGPATGLWAHFTFDRVHANKAPNVVAGSSASCRHAYFIHTSEDAISGKSLRFENGSHDLHVGPGGKGRFTLPYSMALWFKTTKPEVGLANIWRHGRHNTFLTIQDGAPRLSVNHGNQVALAETARIRTDHWHHIVGIVSPTKIEIFLDGTSVASKAVKTDAPPPGSRFRFGPSCRNHRRRLSKVPLGVPLLIDDVRFYGRALNPDEIKTLAQRR